MSDGYLALLMFATAFAWYYVYYRAFTSPGSIASIDAQCYRKFAFTDKEVSPPYCWRPLVPLVARYVDFPVVSYLGLAVGAWAVYALAGLPALFLYCFLPYTLPFNVKNVAYADAVGMALVAAGFLGLQTGAWWVYIPLVLAMLCRELVFVYLLIAAAIYGDVSHVATVLAGVLPWYLLRRTPDWGDGTRHPLVEKSSYDTFLKWANVKGDAVLNYAHTGIGLRVLPFIVPFVWGAVGVDARTALVACTFVTAVFAIGASGQSRLWTYLLFPLLPFLAALPSDWQWGVAILSWWWPFPIFRFFDESGGKWRATLEGTSVKMSPVRDGAAQEGAQAS